MKLPLLLSILLLLVGCSTAPTEEEQEERLYRLEREANNWYFCQRVYKGLGRPTVHVDHQHDRKGRVKGTENQRQVAVRDDLWRNHCKRLLGEAYEE